MNSRKKLVGTIAVGAALLAAPIAQARYGDDMTPARGAASVSTVASSAVRPDDRAGLRGAVKAAVPVTRPDDRAGVRGQSSAPVHVTAVATSDGFDWIDALIGGVGGIATALLLMGGAFLLLNQRSRLRPTPVTTAVAGLVVALVAASAADAKVYVNGPYSTASVGNQIEVVGDHGRTDAQLSRAKVEGLRWQAMADFYSHKTPITTEHSFGASKQRPAEPTVVSVASPGRFDWADAGIGASVGFAALLALSALLFVGRRSRTRLTTA